jgi:hypothetical protein
VSTIIFLVRGDDRHEGNWVHSAHTTLAGAKQRAERLLRDYLDCRLGLSEGEVNEAVEEFLRECSFTRESGSYYLTVSQLVLETP